VFRVAVHSNHPRMNGQAPFHSSSALWQPGLGLTFLGWYYLAINALFAGEKPADTKL